MGERVAVAVRDFTVPPCSGRNSFSAERIRLRLKRSAEDIICIGQELKEAQGKLAKAGSGTFLEWIDAEFDMSKTTAYRFIDVSNRFSSILPNLGKMTASALYQLAAPSTPESVVEAVETGKVEPTNAAIFLCNITQGIGNAASGNTGLF